MYNEQDLFTVNEVFSMEELCNCLLGQIEQPEAVTILMFAENAFSLKNTSSERRRVLEEDDDHDDDDKKVPTGRVTETPDNVIYIKPDAIFGIALSIFVTFVSYVGVMCLYGTNTPKAFASKPFKFGKEM